MRKKIFIPLLITVTALLSTIMPIKASAVSGQAIVNFTNQARAASGLAGLSWRGELASSAWLKAKDICTRQYWSHTAPDGTTAWQLMSQSGYGYVTAGENLAKGFADDAGAVNGWMASPGHRANILNGAFTEVGVGSANCVFEGVETTVIVAHYGASATAPVQNAAPVTTKAPKAAQTATEPTQAAVVSQEQAEPAVLATEPTTEPLGAIIWRLSRATYQNLFID